MPQVLNHLVCAAEADGALDRGLVRLWVTDKGKVSRTKPGLVAKLTSRDATTVLAVRTDAVAEDILLKIECRHLASGMTFGVDVRLRLQTPRDDVPLQALGAAFFRDDLVHLTRNQSVGPNTVEARVRRELSDWLQRDLGAEANPRSLGEPNVQSEWQDKVMNRIAKEYGLKAEVAMRFTRPPAARIDLNDLRVKVQPSDCRIDLTLGLRLTIMPDNQADPFTVRELTEDEARALVQDTVVQHVQDKITLAQLRFQGRPQLPEPGSEWHLGETLQVVLNGALKPFKRTIARVDVEVSPPRHPYSDAEQSLTVEGCSFTPAGWDGKDSIAFRADVRARCINPALFEPLLADVPQRFGSGRDPVVAFIQEKLEIAFRNSIDTSLFEVHRQDRPGAPGAEPVGYADLLERWSSVYHPAIERALGEELGRIGWSSKSIIARPMRDEVTLGSPEGATISLSGLELDSATPGAKIAFSVDVPVRVKEFSDIQHILNRHVRPLDHIRDQIILPACVDFARQTDYLQFFKHFDFGSKEKPEDNFSAGLAAEITAKLKLQKLHVSEAGKISVRQTVTPLSRLWTSITTRPDWKIKTQTPALLLDEETPLEFEIFFTAKITAVAEGGWEYFARNKDIEADDPERGLAGQIAQSLGELGATMTHDDVLTVFDCRTSSQDAKAFRDLIKKRADDILSREFGLIADIVTASRSDLPDEKAKLAARLRGIETKTHGNIVANLSARSIITIKADSQEASAKEAAIIQGRKDLQAFEHDTDPEAVERLAAKLLGAEPASPPQDLARVTLRKRAPAITDQTKPGPVSDPEDGNA